MAKKTIEDGSALERLVAMVEAQGGDSAVILDTDKFEKAPFTKQVFSEKEGYIAAMDTESCGIASSMLGAGRETKESEIDFSAGIILARKVGDYVKTGDVLATMYTSKEELFADAEKRYVSALTFAKEKPAENPLIFARITKDGVEKY